MTSHLLLNIMLLAVYVVSDKSSFWPELTITP